MAKYCGGCKETLDESSFAKNRSSADGLQGWCRECSSRATKMGRAKNPQKYRDCARRWQLDHPEQFALSQRNRSLSRLYGINVEDFDLIFESQGKECAICGEKESGGRGWQVDHDHASGELRGILCHRCNLALGNFCDNVDVIENAVAYLKAEPMGGGA
jgi:hypothetical protein